MIWNEILCLGDSLTSGARDPYGRSYPAELGSMMTSEMNEFYYCHNFSINGETSSDLQKRAWSNISAGKNSKIMILIIGTNDSEAKIPMDIYEDNIRQIVNIARVFGMYVILGTIPNINFTPLYLNPKYIKEYNVKPRKELNFILPIILVIFIELWPLKSTGSFFTTWNATFFWLTISLLNALKKVK